MNSPARFCLSTQKKNSRRLVHRICFSIRLPTYQTFRDPKRSLYIFEMSIRWLIILILLQDGVPGNNHIGRNGWKHWKKNCVHSWNFLQKISLLHKSKQRQLWKLVVYESHGLSILCPLANWFVNQWLLKELWGKIFVLVTFGLLCIL